MFLMEEKIKTVMITMKSVQNADGESNETELITEGKLICMEDRYRIEYYDSEATGFDDSITSIDIINENLAAINRTGKAQSNLVIEINKKHHCHYGTPYGDMMVGIYAHKISSDVDENGGQLYLKYTVDINSSYISDNEIIMNVKGI